MSTGKDKKGAGIATAGQAEARAFVAAEIREEPLRPTLEMDRVQVIDPRHSPTLPPSVLRKKSGPRAPEAPPRGASGAGATDRMQRPATKMQVIKIDPEMLLDLVKERDAGIDGVVDDSERVTVPTAAKSGAAAVKNGAAAVAASPWAVEDAAIEKSALPSALAPSVRSVPVPAAVGAAVVRAAPSGGVSLRRGLVPVVVGVVGVIVAFAVVRWMPARGPGAMSSAAVGASAKGSQEVGAGVGVSGGVGAASAMAAAPAAVVTAEVDAGARGEIGAADGGVPVPVKTKNGGAKKNDDPYDAAAPGPAKTAELVAPPPVTVAPAAPPSPSASSHLYSPVPQY
jgi:hypothetical protein